MLLGLCLGRIKPVRHRHPNIAAPVPGRGGLAERQDDDIGSFEEAAKAGHAAEWVAAQALRLRSEALQRAARRKLKTGSPE